MNNGNKLNNIIILSNVTELATEVAMDLINGDPNLHTTKEGSGKRQREQIRGMFVAKLGATVENKTGRTLA